MILHNLTTTTWYNSQQKLLIIAAVNLAVILIGELDNAVNKLFVLIKSMRGYVAPSIFVCMWYCDAFVSTSFHW